MRAAISDPEEAKGLEEAVTYSQTARRVNVPAVGRTLNCKFSILLGVGGRPRVFAMGSFDAKGQRS